MLTCWFRVAVLGLQIQDMQKEGSTLLLDEVQMLVKLLHDSIKPSMVKVCVLCRTSA